MMPSKIFRYFLISFIIGVGLRSLVAIPMIAVWSVSVIAVTVLAWAYKNGRNVLAVYAIIVFGCILGVVRFSYVERQIPDLRAFSHTRIEVTGVVDGDPYVTQTGQRVILNITKIRENNISVPLSILLLTRKYPSYQRGDVIHSQGMFEQHTYHGTTHGVLFSSQEEKIGQEKGSIFFDILQQSRRAFESHIDDALPEPHAGFMKGLLLGGKKSLPADLIEKFHITGTSHIVALSGYNITLVGTLLVDILLLLTVPFWATFWVASISIILFVALTGAQASLVRAAIMGILILVAAREGRMYHMTNALVFAGVCMLVINPYLLRFDVGFQLSFLATLGLIYFTAPVSRMFSSFVYMIGRLRGRRRIPIQREHGFATMIRKTAVETIAAQIAVLPLLVYLFGGISVIAPVSNLFVLSAIPSTMALGFLTGVTGFLWLPLSKMFGWCAWVFLQYELTVIDIFSRMPFSFMHISFIGLMAIAVIYGIVFVMYKKKSHARGLRIE